MLWVLYIGLTVRADAPARSLGWLGHRRRDDAVQALAHAFSTMPTGGFSTQPDSVEEFSPAAQWIIAALHAPRGRELRAPVPRRLPAATAACSCATRSSGCTWRSSLVASVALLVQLWAYGSPRARRRSGTAVFQAISIITTTGFATTDFALWPVISLLTLFALMFVGRLRGIDDGLDQGRAPPAPRQGAPARARPDREPRGGPADPPQRRAGRRAHAARDRGVHPPVRRPLGGRRARCIAIDSAIGGVRARSARHARGLGERARQRRPRLRDHRPDGLVRRRSATSRRSR